jgi:hypothetical protein
LLPIKKPRRNDSVAKRAGDEARRAILREWDVWAMENSDDANGTMSAMMFFAHLQQNRPDLLEFEYSGADKWQQVHGWLREADRVRE